MATFFLSALLCASAAQGPVYVAADRLRLRDAPKTGTQRATLGINTPLDVVKAHGDWLEVEEPVCGVRGFLPKALLADTPLTAAEAERRADAARDPQVRLTWLERALALDGRRQDLFKQLLEVRTQLGKPLALTELREYLAERRLGPALTGLGIFREGDALVEDGEVWWGLFVDGEAASLAPACAQVKVSHEEGEDGEQVPLRKISVKGGRQPVFLFRGLVAPQAGPVPGRWINTREEPRLGLIYHFEIGAARFWLGATGECKAAGVITDYRVTLAGKVDYPPVTLFERPDTFEPTRMPPNITVEFVGDLDRDGRPDVLLNESPEAIAWTEELRLSSWAPDGKPLGRFASQMISGD